MKNILRTNDPLTCLYCGRKLARRYTTQGVVVTAEQYRELSDADRKQRKFNGHRVAMLLLSASSGYVAALRVPSGLYGIDGLFCTLSCSADFGRAAADGGFRLSLWKSKP